MKKPNPISESLHINEIAKHQAYFAAMALNGILANPTSDLTRTSRTLAEEAVDYSSALIMALLRNNELVNTETEEK